MKRLAQLLFSVSGPLAARPYTVTALSLVALKYAIDLTIAAHFGVPWPVTVYVLPAHDFNIFGIGSQHPQMFWMLWAIALPFFWAGIALTVRRLRDAGLRSAWLVLFFIPIANLLLFLLLSFRPSVDPAHLSTDEDSPELRPDAPLFGLAFAVLLGLLLVLFSVQYLAQYAWGLFLGVPFLVGFVASWFLNARRLHTAAQTSGVAIIAVVVLGTFLLGFRYEGLACLAMALPLGGPIAIGGAMVARSCLRYRGERLLAHSGRLSMCFALLPALMVMEHRVNPEPPVRPVLTSIVVNAPVDTVWKNVIAFTPLDPPKEWIFHAGIAYPIGATITGYGPGAIRRCRFSTGDFVEPITTWDENHLLAFTVAEQPPALAEITLGQGPLHTPHIDRNYLRSRHGQFRLVALDPGHTLLEGTTWYQDYFWPQAYWRPISDAIIHRIHTRVLEHVKAGAESAYRSESR